MVVQNWTGENSNTVHVLRRINCLKARQDLRRFVFWLPSCPSYIACQKIVWLHFSSLSAMPKECRSHSRCAQLIPCRRATGVLSFVKWCHHSVRRHCSLRDLNLSANHFAYHRFVGLLWCGLQCTDSLQSKRTGLSAVGSPKSPADEKRMRCGRLYVSIGS